MHDSTQAPPAIGVIGGSGLYQLDPSITGHKLEIDTPFGRPSDAITAIEYEGRTVYFLPRHGQGHRIAPHEINHRANIYALRTLNVRWILCVTAVGSLREEYRPRDVVLIDQYFDRTSRREHHTFFGSGIVGHVGFAHPISDGLRALCAKACERLEIPYHGRGTYVNMDGPAFSTKAESLANRQLGFDVIGMTNLPEAKLAREAEIALATLSMVTDYDCWKEDEEPVTADAVVAHLQANAATARRLLRTILPTIPTEPNWPEHRSLDRALVTPKELWPQETQEKLAVILGRFMR